MKKPTVQRVLREFSSFLLFFLTVGFVVSCCMMLFLNILSTEMGLTYTPDNIADAAKITFLNVVIITVLFKTADFIRRRIMVDRPVKMITDTAQRIMNGDFSAARSMGSRLALYEGAIKPIVSPIFSFSGLIILFSP